MVVCWSCQTQVGIIRKYTGNKNLLFLSLHSILYVLGEKNTLFLISSLKVNVWT